MWVLLRVLPTSNLNDNCGGWLKLRQHKCRNDIHSAGSLQQFNSAGTPKNLTIEGGKSHGICSKAIQPDATELPCSTLFHLSCFRLHHFLQPSLLYAQAPQLYGGADWSASSEGLIRERWRRR